jgi:glycosyltransferase involved in cell wall biosynthesis
VFLAQVKEGMMRVLFQSRVTLFSGFGGDTVQICKTAEALRELGIVCGISVELQPDLSEWDIVHLFNLTRPQEVYLQARNASLQNKPVVLSTIYLSGADYDRSARTGFAGFVSRLLPPDIFEYAKVIARGLVNREWNDGTWAILRHGYRNLQEEVLRISQVLLPNSHSELERVVRDFPCAGRIHSIVVPNAVDPVWSARQGTEVPSALQGIQDYVLCVANIAPRKNQLELVRALNGLDIPLVIVGAPSPNAHGYFELLQREAGPNVRLVGKVKHEDLGPYYRAAKVHVLASWMETTGLSSLEAGIAGCNLVITDKGDTREYFGDSAYYCDPGSVESIRDAVLKAYAAPRNPELQNLIRTRYNWNQTAAATLRGYRQVFPDADGR